MGRASLKLRRMHTPALHERRDPSSAFRLRQASYALGFGAQGLRRAGHPRDAGRAARGGTVPIRLRCHSATFKAGLAWDRGRSGTEVPEHPNTRTQVAAHSVCLSPEGAAAGRCEEAVWGWRWRPFPALARFRPSRGGNRCAFVRRVGRQPERLGDEIPPLRGAARRFGRNDTRCAGGGKGGRGCQGCGRGGGQEQDPVRVPQGRPSLRSG